MNGSIIKHPKDFGKVAVMMGGSSAEREVSIKSGAAVLRALEKCGVDATGVDVRDDLVRPVLDGAFDRVFNIIHGRGGEDGVLQGVLEALGIPYTGSGVLASALSMDKLRTKLCWRGAGLETPQWMLLRGEGDIDPCIEALGFPVMVKPALEGSSIGMSKASTREELRGAFATAAGYRCDVYAESWVHGSEFTVAVLDGAALPVIRLETPRVFYDYEAKYFSDSTRYHCPCGLDTKAEDALKNLALEASRTLGLQGWARIDVFIDTEGEPQLIEANTVPGMTDHSLVPMAAKAAGIDFEQLVWRILETSLADK
ncbi:MAG: D-alanine--D-alanine ligase [Gammaproteobacteria bacterium]